MRIQRPLLPTLLVTALLGIGATACDSKTTARDGAPPASAAAESPAATISASSSAPSPAGTSSAPSTSAVPSASASEPDSATPSPSASRTSSTPRPAVETKASTTAPVQRTTLRMTVSTSGGRLTLPRGGAAQEFTVTLRNGNAKAYSRIRLGFQMEFMIAEPGQPVDPGTGGFLLERRNPATGTWQPAALRIANDVMVPSLYHDGAPLARNEVRTERYRLRANAGGPVGSNPLMIHALDTSLPSVPLPEGRPATHYLPTLITAG
ncbi:hypothetical protein ACFW2Y_17280 [Streptomyces sp. NPDC058877]|uniref:hypothetical protein n=1 Tax=unclassified Streptomyces TaxID=2593676 RepID=UPI00367EFC2D